MNFQKRGKHEFGMGLKNENNLINWLYSVILPFLQTDYNNERN